MADRMSFLGAIANVTDQADDDIANLNTMIEQTDPVHRHLMVMLMQVRNTVETQKRLIIMLSESALSIEDKIDKINKTLNRE